MKRNRICVMLALAIIIMVNCTTGFAAKETKYVLATEQDRVRTQHDGGFSKIEDIGKDDPHYGWGLGSFYIQGFTEVIKENDGTPVFLKNVGDELILGFDLKRDIDKLGKDKNCRINEDTNGYDKVFEVAQTDFGRGCLIVLETDYQNVTHKPTVYTNYLTAVQNKTANTRVKPFAEGDYSVALDYELKSPGLLGMPAYSDYRVSFKFKIRNSNCMVFFYKLGKNRDEITNGAVAEDGFKVDFKNSYFLTVNVTKDVLVDNEGVLTLDTRYKRAVSDGNEFTDEGLYTITVSNQYTKEKTTKKISVGHNKILNVYAAHNGTLDLNEIARQLDKGAEINDQWKMNLSEAIVEDSYNTKDSEYDGFRTLDSASDQRKSTGNGLLSPMNISIFALTIIVLIVLIKRVEKMKKKDEAPTEIGNNQENEKPVTPVLQKLEDDSSDNDSEKKEE